MTMGDLKFQNPLTNLAVLKTQIPFKGLRSTHGVITKDFLKLFVCLRSGFLEVTNKNLKNILCSLRCAVSLGYSESQTQHKHVYTP
jgi:hypothetical protein